MSELPEIMVIARQMNKEITGKCIAHIEACPTCNTPIIKIKTGSTSSYICPKCQPLK